jgi:hypothetical protein
MPLFFPHDTNVLGNHNVIITVSYATVTSNWPIITTPDYVYNDRCMRTIDRMMNGKGNQSTWKETFTLSLSQP